ncbi:hypothetical protein ACHHYP_20271 [Achlya hypogyna]|uniref:Transmembrane protein n=1 Tax=Achlya hypogyna TaxID=1202772 RepID=A0A1V9YU63_ACHHY|nr:hypothetical protein ACHHYP_20271 [Achlya hypogyna]
MRQKTLVVISEEDEAPTVVISTKGWKTPLFANACDDPPNLAMATCCPLVSVAKVAAMLGCMRYRAALGAGGLWFAFVLLTTVLLVAYDAAIPVVVLSLFVASVPTLILLNLRSQLRDLVGMPKADWEDACVSLWCYPFALAQLTIEVDANTPNHCDFEDNSVLVAFAAT